jgi:hypothetical protein
MGFADSNTVHGNLVRIVVEIHEDVVAPVVACGLTYCDRRADYQAPDPNHNA